MGLGGVIHVFKVTFINNTNIHLTLIDLTNLTKSENSKDAKILVNSRKVAFLGIKNGKIQPFSQISNYNFVL